MRSYMRRYREDGARQEKERASQRAYLARRSQEEPGFLQQRNEYQKAWRAANPDKYRSIVERRNEKRRKPKEPSQCSVTHAMTK